MLSVTGNTGGFVIHCRVFSQIVQCLRCQGFRQMKKEAYQGTRNIKSVGYRPCIFGDAGCCNGAGRSSWQQWGRIGAGGLWGCSVDVGCRGSIGPSAELWSLPEAS